MYMYENSLRVNNEMRTAASSCNSHTVFWVGFRKLNLLYTERVHSTARNSRNYGAENVLCETLT